MEINKAVLDCMQHLRRRLRDEQQLDIRLSQPDAVQAMLAACLRSNNETTRDLGKQLATIATYPRQPRPSHQHPNITTGMCPRSVSIAASVS